MPKKVTMGDFLTQDEIAQAIRLGDRTKVRDQLIVPNMERINAALGQENDPDYLAFAIGHMMVEHGAWQENPPPGARPGRADEAFVLGPPPKKVI